MPYVIRSVVVLFVFFAANSLAVADTNTEISQILDYYADEWNKGEITSLESYYHPDFVVVTAEGAQSRENRIGELKILMGSEDDRGTLSITDVQIQPLAEKHAMAYGRTRLRFKDGTELGGMFTTVYVKTPFGWKALLSHE